MSKSDLQMTTDLQKKTKLKINDQIKEESSSDCSQRKELKTDTKSRGLNCIK